VAGLKSRSDARSAIICAGASEYGFRCYIREVDLKTDVVPWDLKSLASADAKHAKASPGQRLLSIQYLRAIAALMVVFHHARDQFSDFPGPFLTTAGAAGVDLFFVVSGYVMVFVTNTREHSASDFLKSRVARIVPIYWFYTFGSFFLILIAPTLFRSNEASFRHLVLSLFFIPHSIAADPHSSSPIVKLGWTLNYEIFFYVVFACAMVLSGARRVALTTGALVILIGIGEVQKVSGIGNSQSGYFFYTNPIIGEFALGMLIARAHLTKRLDWVGTLPAIAMLLLAFPTMVWGARYAEEGRLLFWGGPAALILVSALTLEKRGMVGRYPLLLLVGDASYSLYLVQIFPIAVLRTIWRRFGLSVADWPNSLLFVGGSIFFALLLGILSYYAVERPALQWARRFLRAGAKPGVT
jgi:exopolysaccharide production protein ExoZ